MHARLLQRTQFGSTVARRRPSAASPTTRNEHMSHRARAPARPDTNVLRPKACTCVLRESALCPSGKLRRLVARSSRPSWKPTRAAVGVMVAVAHTVVRQAWRLYDRYGACMTGMAPVCQQGTRPDTRVSHWRRATQPRHELARQRWQRGGAGHGVARTVAARHGTPVAAVSHGRAGDLAGDLGQDTPASAVSWWRMRTRRIRGAGGATIGHGEPRTQGSACRCGQIRTTMRAGCHRGLHGKRLCAREFRVPRARAANTRQAVPGIDAICSSEFWKLRGDLLVPARREGANALAARDALRTSVHADGPRIPDRVLAYRAFRHRGPAAASPFAPRLRFSYSVHTVQRWHTPHTGQPCRVPIHASAPTFPFTVTSVAARATYTLSAQACEPSTTAAS